LATVAACLLTDWGLSWTALGQLPAELHAVVASATAASSAAGAMTRLTRRLRSERLDGER
jgi:hypothetical protein